jgi:hypothetical protein
MSNEDGETHQELLDKYRKVANDAALNNERGPFCFILSLDERIRLFNAVIASPISIQKEASETDISDQPYICGARIVGRIENLYFYVLDSSFNKEDTKKANSEMMQAVWNHIKYPMLHGETDLIALAPSAALINEDAIKRTSYYLSSRDYVLSTTLPRVFQQTQFLKPEVRAGSPLVMRQMIDAIERSAVVKHGTERLSFLMNVFASISAKHGICPPRWGDADIQ